MKARIPVEIGIFCSFIERICGSLIVYDRYEQTGSLNGVMLPRSWLKVILDTFQSTEKDTKSRLWLLLQSLEELLRTPHYNNFSNPGKIQLSIQAQLELIHQIGHLLYGLQFGQLEDEEENIRYILLECELRNFDVGMWANSRPFYSCRALGLRKSSCYFLVNLLWSLKLDVTYTGRLPGFFAFSDRFLIAIANSPPFTAGEEFCFVWFNNLSGIYSPKTLV